MRSLDGAALPRAAPHARRVRARDAARRPGHLSQGPGDDPVLGRRLPGLSRAGGRHRLRRAHAGAAAGGGPRGPRDHLRAARRVRAARAGQHPHAGGRGDQPHRAAAPGRGGARRRGAGGPRRPRPAGAVEAHEAVARVLRPGRHLPVLRADHHPVAPDRRGAQSRAGVGAGGDVRDARPSLEHRGHVGAALPSHGGPHRVHHRGPPRGARGGRRRVRRGRCPSRTSSQDSAKEPR